MNSYLGCSHRNNWSFVTKACQRIKSRNFGIYTCIFRLFIRSFALLFHRCPSSFTSLQPASSMLLLLLLLQPLQLLLCISAVGVLVLSCTCSSPLVCSLLKSQYKYSYFRLQHKICVARLLYKCLHRSFTNIFLCQRLGVERS